MPERTRRLRLPGLLSPAKTIKQPSRMKNMPGPYPKKRNMAISFQRSIVRLFRALHVVQDSLDEVVIMPH